MLALIGFVFSAKTGMAQPDVPSANEATVALAPEPEALGSEREAQSSAAAPATALRSLTMNGTSVAFSVSSTNKYGTVLTSAQTLVARQGQAIQFVADAIDVDNGPPSGTDPVYYHWGVQVGTNTPTHNAGTLGAVFFANDSPGPTADFIAYAENALTHGVANQAGSPPQNILFIEDFTTYPTANGIRFGTPLHWNVTTVANKKANGRIVWSHDVEEPNS